MAERESGRSRRPGPRRPPGAPSGPDEVRRAVLDAAATLFAQRGLADVSLRDIAAAADTHVAHPELVVAYMKAMIKDVDLVPNLSPKNMVSIGIAKDFMLSHGDIHNDYDVDESAAPEFFEQAARELLEEEWTRQSTSKLPEPTELGVPSTRLG